MTGIERIAAERKRQVEEEGWSAEHDAEHVKGEMATAAVAYIQHGEPFPAENRRGWVTDGERLFPWGLSWWKPVKKDPLDMTQKDRIRHLEKAGALIAAEIDRLLALKP